MYTFARYDLPHRDDTHDRRADLDLVSCGVVKVLDGGNGGRYPEMSWEPKAAFDTLAACYGR